jgi:hypothetical protein|tara:strand:+ start:20664 stop:20993 length:330 start_codon:yes stop_codon:yes gene_type:complete
MMNDNLLTKEGLRSKLLILMDEVANAIAIEPDVDKFLDRTDLFDYWEKIIPEPEYPIFIMAVLNNIKRDVILNTIIEAVLERKVHLKKASANPHKKRNPISNIGEHPFS